MTYVLTTKQRELLAYLRHRAAPKSVYALANSLGRPYNRVLDNVRDLHKAGLVSLSERRLNGRRAITVSRRTDRDRQPALTYSRSWSVPVTGVDDDTLIAGVLSSPNFEDVLRCCLHYGVPRVRAVFHAMMSADELSPLVQAAVGRMLGNMEIGIARAA